MLASTFRYVYVYLASVCFVCNSVFAALLSYHTMFNDLPQAIWDHTGDERKGAPPGSPDEYRETVYARPRYDTYRVKYSLIEEERAAETSQRAQ